MTSWPVPHMPHVRSGGEGEALQASEFHNHAATLPIHFTSLHLHTVPARFVLFTSAHLYTLLDSPETRPATCSALPTITPRRTHHHVHISIFHLQRRY